MRVRGTGQRIFLHVPHLEDALADGPGRHLSLLGVEDELAEGGIGSALEQIIVGAGRGRFEELVRVERVLVACVVGVLVEEVLQGGVEAVVAVSHAAVEASLEEADAEDGEEEKEEATDDDDVARVGDGGDQGVDDELELGEPLDHAQGTEDAERSEGLEGAALDRLGEREDRDEDNGCVEYVPRVAQVGSLVHHEAEGDDLGHELDHEDDREDEVECLEGLVEAGLLVAQGVVQGEAEGGDENADQDELVEELRRA